MTASASPTNKRSSHHVVLTQGATSVGLILCNSQGKAEPRAFRRQEYQQSALQISTGQQKHADFSGFWKYIEQNDWSGGRGANDFDKDTSMYLDGYQINTMRPGEVILGPKSTIVSFGALVSMSNNIGIHYNTKACYFSGAVTGSTVYYRTNNNATVTITVKDVTVTLRKTSGSATAGIMSLGIKPDGGSEVWSDNSIFIPSISSDATSYKFTFAAGVALTSAQDFYLTFKNTGVTSSAGITIAHQESGSECELSVSTDGSTYTDTGGLPQTPSYVMTNGGSAKNRAHLFEYKGALYYAMQNNNGTSSKLYLNGDHGLAKTGATTTGVTIKGQASWATDEAIGCICVIVSGTGSSQPQNWRVITDSVATSSSETALTFSDPWDIAPAENDVLAIIASNKFTEIAGFDTAYNVVVTDVLSINGAVYFACGDTEVLKRVIAFNSGGTWTYHYSGSTAGQDAETGAFTFLAFSAGRIWGAKGGYPATVAYATAVDYTGYTGTETVLTFGTAQVVGDQYERITGLERYAEAWQNLMVALKEGSMHRWREGTWEEFDIRQMGATRDRRNGAAHCVQDTYLYMSWHNTVLRYYNGLLDGVGPDKAEVAVPTSDRFGYFSALVGYPGMLIGAVDAGSAGVSNVIAYNDRGWCELYRGTLGERIQNLYIQSIPGNAVDRLWICEGNNIIWLPLSTDPFNHPADTYNGYKFATEGTLITAYHYVELQEVDKLYYAMRTICEGAGTDETVTLAYRLDNATSWTDVTGTIDTFSEELELATTPSVVGKRIQFKFTLKSVDGNATPRILAMVHEAMPRIQTRHAATLTFRIADKDFNLLGKPDDYTDHNLKMNALDTMKASATPVYVTSVATPLNGRYAWVENVTLNPDKIVLETGEEAYMGQMMLVEIDS